MIECAHEAAERFRVCSHLIGGEVPFVTRYSGRGTDCEWICKACVAEPTELHHVCAACRDTAKEGGFEDDNGVIGTPGIVDEPSALHFEHRVRAPLVHPVLVDVQPIHGGDRDVWIGVSAEGELFHLDLDRRTVRSIARATGVVLAEPLPLALHVSRTGRFAAVVQRRGAAGAVIELATGTQTMTLARDDYHAVNCNFPVALIEREGRDLVIHGPDWNRLDIFDARSGELVTPRTIAEYTRDGPDPEHYLDYFHCGLSVSPDQSWIVDNGWVWHPVGIAIAWSLERWLADNVWESEDGPTRHQLTSRAWYWDGPLCWIDNHRVAVWGYGENDPLLAAVQIFDLPNKRLEKWFPGPQGDLVFDRVLVALDGERGSTAWSVEHGARLMTDAHAAPARYHPTAKTFLAFEHGLVTSRLRGLHAAASWNTGVVGDLVASISRSGAFDELPVLGDALEAAGCDDREILDHCQHPGEHGDRCWVLDRLHK